MINNFQKLILALKKLLVMRKRFEYKTVEIKSKSVWSTEVPTKEIDEVLNQFGQEGWDLVAVKVISSMGTSLSSMYTFKREL